MWGVAAVGYRVVSLWFLSTSSSMTACLKVAGGAEAGGGSQLQCSVCVAFGGAALGATWSESLVFALLFSIQISVGVCSVTVAILVQFNSRAPFTVRRRWDICMARAQGLGGRENPPLKEVVCVSGEVLLLL